MNKKIVGMIGILLIMVTSFPVTANTTPSNQQTKPEGRIIFTARSTGPCVMAWGFGVGNESIPGAYYEPARGFIIQYGTMLYHSPYGFFTNYIIENNITEQLWNVKEITLIGIKWQHEKVNHVLWAVCTPLEETTGSFFFDSNGTTGYIISPPPTLNPRNHTSNCMAYTGFHKNGSKIERISGYAWSIVGTEELPPSESQHQSGVMIGLLQNKGGGEYEYLLDAAWFKYGIDINGTIIEKANTFHGNYWKLPVLFSP